MLSPVSGCSPPKSCRCLEEDFRLKYLKVGVYRDGDLRDLWRNRAAEHLFGVDQLAIVSEIHIGT